MMSESQGGERAGSSIVAANLRDRADMLATAGDFAQALPLYRALVAAAPNDAALRRKLAGALEATEAGEEAVACYRRALALDPSDARAHDELGRLMGRRGDMAGAVVAIDQPAPVGRLAQCRP
jgi:tetratricopeptide (TPR) repeat protein